MASTEAQDWDLPVQQEYDSAVSNIKPIMYDSSDFSGRKVYGEDLESFVIASNGKTFVVSSELGGNTWQGFIGVYNSWSDAESGLSKPSAYFVDNSTTFSCSAGLSDSAIVCGADKGTIELVRFTSGDNFPDVRIYNSLIGHDDVVSSVSISMDCSHVISGSFDCSTKSWDLDSGACMSTSTVSNDRILAVASSPLEKHLYCAASRDGKLYLLDSRLCSGVAPSVITSPACRELSPGAYPTALSWPESLSDVIYAGYSDGSLICFDLKAPQNVVIRPHGGAICSLDVHPENSMAVASGSEDGNVCVEDFSLQCEKRHVVVGKHSGFVRCVKWSCDEGLICSAGWDGKLHSFPTSSLTIGRRNRCDFSTSN